MKVLYYPSNLQQLLVLKEAVVIGMLISTVEESHLSDTLFFLFLVNNKEYWRRFVTEHLTSCKG